MVEVLLSGILAMVISIVAGPKFIDFLRRNELGQHIREEGPERHVTKQGTPTMGGLLIMISMSVPFLVFTERTLPALTAFFVTLGCAAIGFVDDWTKLTHRRSLGLAGRWKLLLLAGISAVVAYLAHRTGTGTSIILPAVGSALPLSWGWYALLFFVIAGAANGVNLTDGIDGLAAGTGIIAIFTFTAMAVLTYVRSGQLGAQSIPYLDMAILGGALIGASIGFLWYNAFPAEVFMGDTGSMALGGALGAFAVMMKAEVLLLLIGGIFVVEALSVMVQVFTFKYLGRRVFLMAPIHHHFELQAWSETKIILRFWIVAAVCSAIGFTLYQQSVV